MPSTVGTQTDFERKRIRLADSVRQTVFIVGTAALVLVACRNSVTWHLQQFWGASGNFWQTQWSKVFAQANGDEWTLGVTYPWLVSTLSLWVFNIFYLFIDFVQPKWALAYKIQPDMSVTRDDIRKAAVRVLFNQVFVGYPITVLIFHMMQWRGCSLAEELPTFAWVVYELAVCVLVEELGFYYSHRLLHHPKLYKRVHKMHHEFTAPIGLAGIYAHPIEMILSNALPLAAGPIVCGSHVGTAMLWYIMATFSVTVAHSGYHFPFLPSPEAHDFHHLKFTQNFGMLGVLDRLHGTDSVFRASKAHKRHVLLLSLVPLRQLIPDEKETPPSTAGPSTSVH